MTRTIKERLYRRMEVDETTGCWEWTGSKFYSGYGQFRAGKSAHIISYKEHNGPIPPGHHLHHICENKGCINPLHLMPVTPQQHADIRDYSLTNRIHNLYCPQGHFMVGDNIIFDATSGARRCKKCRKEQNERAKKRRNGNDG